MTISILGCGWLGLPLGESLVGRGFAVKGSTTHEEKLAKIKAVGIEPCLFELNPQVVGKNVDNFLATNILMIDIPPRLRVREADFHIEQIKNLLLAIEKSSLEKIIFISSTSVYPELNREVFEEDISTPEQSASAVLVQIELLLKEFCAKTARKLTILRFGGLMGYDRIPVKYFAGWKGLTTGDTPVNYIHRDDAIGIITEIIEKNIWGETLNVVSPIHPTRKEIYEKNAQELGFEKPEFVTPTEVQPFKIISSKKLEVMLQYNFKYTNPLDFLYEKI